MEPNLTLALALIAAGFLLMVAELFIPSGGILAVLSAVGLIGGIVVAFFYDQSTGMWVLMGVAIALPIVGSLMLYYWPRTPMGKMFFLPPQTEDTTMTGLAVNQELEELRGQFGQAISTLRPAGVVDFNGKRVDSITEGMMVERGQWVRCIDVRAGRVLVRPAQKPNLNDLETADFS